MRYYLAVDIGASSGRHIVGWDENGKLCTEEVYRFPNGVHEHEGSLIWDIDSLTAHVKEGIRKAKAHFGQIESLSVDTWGVDYVLLKGDEEVRPVYAYRDSRTETVTEEVHAIIPFSELYSRTGIQFAKFNSIYQLYADKKSGRLQDVTDFLMIPAYLMYRLTGVKAQEYTNATTMGLVNALTGEFDMELIRRLGLPEKLFPTLKKPGTVLGMYEGIKVVLCATHDTGSAVEGIPMTMNAPYISSGTWSLLGVKTNLPITDEPSRKANYSNEGGVGYNRYQKNIMGMWVVNRLRSELCPDSPFSEIVQAAETSEFTETVNINDSDFLSPKSMREAFDRHLGSKPEKTEDYFSCAYRSLADSYREALEELERNTGRTYDTVYIVGGGAKNAFLNKLTEQQTGKKIIALPIEATAIGNLRIQMKEEVK